MNPTVSDVVEVMARAMRPIPWAALDGDEFWQRVLPSRARQEAAREHSLGLAGQIIAALSAAGYAIVPVEVTEEMLDEVSEARGAGNWLMEGLKRSQARKVWATMIQAFVSSDKSRAANKEG